MNRLINYFREAIAEVRKITWPTKKQTTQYTITVIIISIGLALFLAGLDYVFNLGLQALLTK